MGYVEIAPKTVDGVGVIPAFVLNTHIDNFCAKPVDVYRTAPTLRQLRHAYETSQEIERSVRGNLKKGEWTATFLRDGKEVVERPEKVHYDEKSGLWIAEGGDVHRVDLPPEGWALDYEQRGFPTRTGTREEAEKVFGEDASYFWAGSNGLRAVGRGFCDLDSSPIGVSAYWYPDDGLDHIGSRLVIE